MNAPSTLRYLLTGSLQGLLIRIASIALLFLLETSLGRWLGPQGYGTFAFCRTAAVTVLMIALAGLHVSSIRFLSVYLGERQWGLFRGFLIWSNAAFACSALAGLAAAWVVLLALADRLDDGLWATLAVSVWLIPVMGFSYLRQSALRSMRRVVAATLPVQVLTPALALTFLLPLAHVTEIDSVVAMSAFLAASLLSAVAGAVWLLKLLPAQAKTARPEFRAMHWLKVSLPMMMYELVRDAMSKTDMLMLGWLTTMQSVGLFAVPHRLAILTQLPVTIVNLVVGPVIAREFKRGERQHLQRVVWVCSLLTLVTTGAISTPLLLEPEFFLGLFGAEFAVATEALYFLILGNGIQAFCGPNLVLLLMSGEEKQVAKILAAFVLFDLLLNAVLIPQYGFVGAAASACIALSGCSLAATVVCYRRLGIVSCFHLPLALPLRRPRGD